MAFILPLVAMLTKEPEMLQPDAFCEHTMQQNATAARAAPWTPLGEPTVLHRLPSWFQSGRRGRDGRRMEGMGKEKEEKGMEGGEVEGEGGGGTQLDHGR